MKVKIDIDTKTFVRFWLVLAGFALAIFSIYMARTALVIIGAGFFLALALSYPVSWLTKYMPKNSRVLATIAAYLLTLAIASVSIFMIIPPILEQTAKVVDTVPHMIDDASRQWNSLGELIQRYNIQPQVDEMVTSAQSSLARWISGFGGNVVSSVNTIMSNIAMTIFAIVISFLMLVEGPRLYNSLWSLYSNKERLNKHKHVLSRMHHAISGYVAGQVSMSAVGAIVTGMIVFVISMFIPEVPTNLVLPSIAFMFVLALVPMFGTSIAAVIIGILIALNSVPAAIAFAVTFILYQQLENNIIYPAIQSKFVEMSPLMVLLAVVIGVYLFGLAGGIISIPFAASIRVLFEEYIVKNSEARKEKETSKVNSLKYKLLKNSEKDA